MRGVGAGPGRVGVPGLVVTVAAGGGGIGPVHGGFRWSAAGVAMAVYLAGGLPGKEVIGAVGNNSSSPGDDRDAISRILGSGRHRERQTYGHLGGGAVRHGLTVCMLGSRIDRVTDSATKNVIGAGGSVDIGPAIGGCCQGGSIVVFPVAGGESVSCRSACLVAGTAVDRGGRVPRGIITAMTVG